MTMMNVLRILFLVGGRETKEYDKRYIYASLCGKQSKQAHDPNTI